MTTGSPRLNVTDAVALVDGNRDHVMLQPFCTDHQQLEIASTVRIAVNAQK